MRRRDKQKQFPSFGVGSALYCEPISILLLKMTAVFPSGGLIQLGDVSQRLRVPATTLQLTPALHGAR